MKPDSTQSRLIGSFIGLACGDAGGTTLEFKSPGSFQPITDMVGGGPFNLNAGHWTDDTSMAICLGQSLLHCKGFDALDQMNRELNRVDIGYPSSTGTCFDVGNKVISALVRFKESGNPFAGSTNKNSAGNGSLMRLAPVVIYYYPDREKAIRFAGESSKTTHATAEAVDSCMLFADILCNAFSGLDKSSVLTDLTYEPKSDSIQKIKERDYLNKKESQIRGTGYVVKSLEAALWCFATTDSFEQAILKAANLGDDADTTAAICGQIAGAFYGLEGIPKHWRERLTDYEMLHELAEGLAGGGY